jgi:hypothetical protein
MLPILRILPVGGVLLAILILVLALIPPDGSRTPMSSTIVPARGALVDRDHRPEVRQYLIHAALKRANELNRLRELPDTPARPEDSQPRLAGLPTDPSDMDPQETGSINEAPVVSIPFEIREPPPIELHGMPTQDATQAVKLPEQAKLQREARRRARPRNASRPTATAQERPFNFFDILFGRQSASITQQAGSQPYPYPMYSYQQTGGQQQTGGHQYQYPAYSNQQAGYQQYQPPIYNYQQTGQQQYQRPTYGTVEANQSKTVHR